MKVKRRRRVGRWEMIRNYKKHLELKGYDMDWKIKKGTKVREARERGCRRVGKRRNILGMRELENGMNDGKDDKERVEGKRNILEMGKVINGMES